MTNPLMQLSIPVEMVIPLSSTLNIYSSFSFGRTDYTALINRRQFTNPEHTEYVFSPKQEKWNLSGLSDFYVQGNMLMWDSRLLCIAGLGLPVGKTKLNYMENIISNYLYNNIFQFQMPVYGQGFFAKAGAFLSYPLMENLVLGGGLSYHLRGEYVPLHNYLINDTLLHNYDKKFDPGDEFCVHMGLDVRLMDDMKWMLDGIVTYFQRDIVDGEEMYQSGTRLTLNTGLFYRYDEQYVWLLMNYRQKNKNRYLQAIQFQEEAYNTNRPELDLNLIWKAFAIVGGGIHILVDGRFYGENEAGQAKTHVLGGGFGGEYRFSYSTTMEFYLKYLAGSREQGNIKLNVEGMDISVKMKYEF
ncbi:hypothetical protein JW948_13395 [bacterium]|nr:hypothetical protein [bacterium]